MSQEWNDLNQKSKSSTKGHVIYIRKCYESLRREYYHEAVFECMNSWGLSNPIPLIRVDSPAICRIFKISLHYLQPLRSDLYHGVSGDCRKQLIDDNG